MYILLLMVALMWKGENRWPCEPYISGDTFRAHCDFVFDESNYKIDFKKSRYGSTYFVEVYKLPLFFQLVHPHIPFPYVLVSHNGDNAAPGECEAYLDDPKLLAWYGQNAEVIHPKLHPIPIGIANRKWAEGDVALLTHTIQSSIEKSHLLYLNFKIANHPKERQLVFDLFKDCAYCYSPPVKPRDAFLADIASSKFVLSPRGNGLDCYRTWEALYLGCIPIVRASTMDSILKDLPVLIVNEWTEINEEFLNRKWAEHLVTQYNMETLYFDYWLKQINQYKRR